LEWELTCGARVGRTDMFGPLRMPASCRDGRPNVGGLFRYLTCGPECCRSGTCVRTVVVSPYKYVSQCCRPWTVVREDRKVREHKRAECELGVSTGSKPSCWDDPPTDSAIRSAHHPRHSFLHNRWRLELAIIFGAERPKTLHLTRKCGTVTEKDIRWRISQTSAPYRHWSPGCL
jgi:hypothetical protein